MSNLLDKMSEVDKGILHTSADTIGYHYNGTKMDQWVLDILNNMWVLGYLEGIRNR